MCVRGGGARIDLCPVGELLAVDEAGIPLKLLIFMISCIAAAACTWLIPGRPAAISDSAAWACPAAVCIQGYMAAFWPTMAAAGLKPMNMLAGDMAAAAVAVLGRIGLVVEGLDVETFVMECVAEVMGARETVMGGACNCWTRLEVDEGVLSVLSLSRTVWRLFLLTVVIPLEEATLGAGRPSWTGRTLGGSGPGFGAILVMPLAPGSVFCATICGATTGFWLCKSLLMSIKGLWDFF